MLNDSLRYYQYLAGRTRNKDIQPLELANYGLGLTGEAGEVADHIKKYSFHKHELPKDEIEKELGDVLWYIANIANVLDLDLNVIAKKNIDKLQKRYPQGFSSSDSINREL